MKSKLDMAHDWYLKHAGGARGHMGLEVTVAWEYADKMQAEADKRNKAEAEQKRKAVREMLNADNTFLEKEGQHFDDVADVCKTYSSSEWQPDWSQAPDWAIVYTYDQIGGQWWDVYPFDSETMWLAEGIFQCISSPSFDYKGDWKDSLRRRPEDK